MDTKGGSGMASVCGEFLYGWHNNLYTIELFLGVNDTERINVYK